MTERTFSARRGLYVALGVLALFILVLSLYYFALFTSIRNTEWHLVSINGHPPLDGENITLIFSDDRVSGTTFCPNIFSGTYTVTLDGKLVISHIALSATPCLADEVSAQDGIYLNTLFKAPTFQVRNERLEIYNEAGQAVLVYVRR